ncbi:16S rRNA (cytosine(1402)-N(4))-methyltransferase [hydrothermal vent metagenome]|uniref:16S rRNA (Cytosine(1402)-N(4))-methyltransferase n=1 Tax=hydrothermal vent metagenome TaxID=652676 RepID=A0A3B0UUU9_9ZZZZ
MLQECIDGLAIKPNGIYVDLTFGGGGHSKEILKHLTNGKLYGFDQDDDAKQQSESIKDEQFEFVNANFRYIKKYLRLYGVKHVDGILADLGISSHQIDVPERGFSTRFNAALDMRMDQSNDLTAEEIINEYSEKELIDLFSRYGEVKNARTLAAAIVSERVTKRIESVDELKAILEKYAKRGKQFKYFAQVFQALRIVVNDEMGALEEMIEQATEILKPDGRFVVMSYHSLEDRPVKNYFSKGKFKGEVEKDFYGNMIRPLEPITRKPIIASEEELKLNNRARSAKLRIAKKLAVK